MSFRCTLIGCVFLWGSVSTATGQTYLDYRQTQGAFDSMHIQQLRFRLEGSTFFKNNEYFGDLIEGYTLIGYSARPTLSYTATPQIRFTAGLQLQQYGGTSRFDGVLPVFTVHARLSPAVELLMGNIRGNVHHQLSEVLMDPEKAYTRPEETGLQFLFNLKRWTGDLWLDWEQFIKINDTIPEKFTAGLSSTLRIASATHWRIDAPIQMVATHRGGQISNYSMPLESLVNFGTGISFTNQPNTKLLKKYQLQAMLFAYKDLTNKKERPFSNGYAIYPNATFDHNRASLTIGYWYAKNFYAPKGNPLFQSISTYQPDYYSANRQLLNFKLFYHKWLHPSIRLQAGVEGYYDLKLSELEYVYGVQLVFHPDFKITNIKL